MGTRNCIVGGCLVALAAGMACSTADAQQFQRVVGLADAAETSLDIQRTRDGGYISVGFRRTLNNSDFHIIKMGLNGNVQWERLAGLQGVDIASSVVQTSDGGYLVAGETNGFAATQGILLVKLDAAGNQMWAGTYAGTPFIGGHTNVSARELSNGDIAVVGRRQNAAGGPVRALYLRTNSGGAPQLQVEYAAPAGTNINESSFADLRLAPSGELVVAGHLRVTANTPRDAMMTRLDPTTGMWLSGRLYGTTADDELFDGLDLTFDREAILTGWKNTAGGLQGSHVVKALYPTGAFLWARYFNNFRTQEAAVIVDGPRLPVVAGQWINGAFGGTDAGMFGLTPGGGLLWQYTYGAQAADSAFGLANTPDGYHAGGSTASFPFGALDASNAYFIKTNKLGVSKCFERRQDVIATLQYDPRDIALVRTQIQGVTRLDNICRGTQSGQRVLCFSRCIADFNGDEYVDFFDFDDFVLAFESGDPRADVNDDGFVDFFDFDDFVLAFEVGC
jgi:hypothetical protein